MENTKKWSEEFIMINDVTDKNKLLFIKSLEFISIVLSKNDDGSGYDWTSDTERFNDEFCSLLETMCYDYEMKQYVSGLMKIILEYEYEW
jgi:hypothetical protein